MYSRMKETWATITQKGYSLFIYTFQSDFLNTIIKNTSAKNNKGNLLLYIEMFELWCVYCLEFKVFVNL